MTTSKDQQNTGKLERTLDGVQRKVADIRSMVKGMYEKVSELVNTADSIYDTLGYQRDSSFYHLSRDDILDGLE